MIIDGTKKFKMLQALNGNKTAMCELISSEFEEGDNMLAYWCMELLADSEPEVCEKLLLEVTGEELPYETMLMLIAENYYYEWDNQETAYRWFQKFFDYMDFKHKDLPEPEKEALKNEWHMYKYMKDNYLLGRNENRFMLKWEQELLYKN